jgi:alkylhydroperoxidase family enzyme
MERLMGHAPHILDPWTKLEDAFFASKTPALLEQVRRTLALGTGCRYCQAKGGPPDRSQADLRTAAAVELAEHFARDHRSIDEMALARARDHFADAELCELVMFMGFIWAGGTFGAVLGLEPLRSSL